MSEGTPSKIATSLEEAAAILAERSAIDGDDWRVKIMRRASGATPQESIAIFGGATLQQLLSPEPWLVKFAGGSPYYTFRVVHEKDRGTDRPSAIYTLPAIPGTPQSPNMKIVGQPGWTGPASLEYPTEDASKKNGADKWPGSPDTHTGVPRQPAPQGADGGAGPFSSVMAELQRERVQLAEDRHRMEIDAIRRAADEDRKRLEAKFSDVVTELRSTREKPQTSMEETLVKIVAAVTPIVAAIAPLIMESRKTRDEAERRREEREAERDSKRQERESALMEKIATQSTESAKVIGVFTDSLSTVARSMVQTVAMVGELRQPEPQEDGIMSVLKAGIAAWAESSARGAPAPMSDPRLTQGQRSPPPQARPAQPPAPPPVAAQPSQPEPTPEGEPASEEEETVTPEQMLDMLAQAIGGLTPPDDLAPDIVEALTAPEFVEAIKANGGVLAALQKRLGNEWGNDASNVAYVQALFARVGQIAQANGVDVRPLFPQ